MNIACEYIVYVDIQIKMYYIRINSITNISKFAIDIKKMNTLFIINAI